MCSPGCCRPGEDTLAGSPVAGWGAGCRRPDSSALNQGHRGQQSGIWGLFKAVSGGLSGNSIAISSASLLVEMIPETLRQYHFVSSLAPLPVHTANLCLSLFTRY